LGERLGNFVCRVGDELILVGIADKTVVGAAVGCAVLAATDGEVEGLIVEIKLKGAAVNGNFEVEGNNDVDFDGDKDVSETEGDIVGLVDNITAAEGATEWGIEGETEVERGDNESGDSEVGSDDEGDPVGVLEAEDGRTVGVT